MSGSRSRCALALLAILASACGDPAPEPPAPGAPGASARPSASAEKPSAAVATDEPGTDPDSAVDEPASSEGSAAGEPAEIWTVRTGGEVWSTPVIVNAGAETDIGSIAVFGSDDGVLRAVDVARGRERFARRLDDRLRGAPAVVSTKSGRWAIVASESGTVHGVDLGTGETIWSRKLGATVSVTAFAEGVVTVDTEGRVVALAAADGSVRWRRAVGEARGAPVVGSGRVVVVTKDGAIHGLDAAGRPAWRTEAGAETAPALGDGLVFAVGGGSMVALDAADGGEIWRARVGEFVGAPPAVSPGDTAGRVFVATGDGWLLAFDARAGAELWRRRLDGPMRGSPAPGPGDTIFLGVGEHALVGLDAATGEGLWSFATDTWITGAVAAAENRLLFGGVDGVLYGVRVDLPEGASSAGSSTAPRPEVVVGPSFFEGVPSIDWTTRLGSPIFAPPVFAGPERALVAAPGALVALDATTGKRVGSVETAPVLARPVVERGTVFVGDLAGRLRAVDIESMEMRWTRDLGAPVREAPRVEGDRLWIGTEGIGTAGVRADAALHALDATTGAVLWSARGLGPASPIRLGSSIVGGGCGGVAAFDAESGRELWRHELGGCVEAGLVASGGGLDGLFVADTAGHVASLEPAVGGVRWSLDAESGVRHAPAVVFGSVLLPGDDGRLRGVDAVGGFVRWSFPAGPRLSSDVVVHDGIAYAGSVDGRLYAVNAVNGDELWRLVLAAPVRGAAVEGRRLVAVSGDGIVTSVELP